MATDVSAVSVFMSVAAGNVGDADSTCPETAAETRPPAVVSDSSSIAGHEVLAGMLLSRSFNAFSASCLLCDNINTVVRQTRNKAIVDYTSPALCTPVTSLPLTGDTAYCQHAGGGQSHWLGNMHKKFGKHHTCGSGDILADRQIHILIITSQSLLWVK